MQGKQSDCVTDTCIQKKRQMYWADSEFEEDPGLKQEPEEKRLRREQNTQDHRLSERYKKSLRDTCEPQRYAQWKEKDVGRKQEKKEKKERRATEKAEGVPVSAKTPEPSKNNEKNRQHKRKRQEFRLACGRG